MFHVYCFENGVSYFLFYIVSCFVSRIWCLKFCFSYFVFRVGFGCRVLCFVIRVSCFAFRLSFFMCRVSGMVFHISRYVF